MNGRMLAQLQAEVGAEVASMTALRRRLHHDPRLSSCEETTLVTVLEHLPPGASRQRVGETGAVVRIGHGGPSVAVRAELDALPVQERTGVDWASTNGAMHACGHDVHLASLVALARAVNRVAAAAPLLAILQPREETYPSGAEEIVDAGVLTGHQVAAIVGAHVHPLVKEGEVACSEGPINAASDEFQIEMHGAGGHAAYPNLTPDPVLAIAQFTLSVQQLVSRNVDPMIPAVVTVGAIHSGEASNATPPNAVARGIIRSMSEDQRRMLHQRLRAVAEGTALTHGCGVDLKIVHGEPVLENHPRLVRATRSRLETLGLRLAPALRSCGSDDFAFFSAVAPAMMMFVGCGRENGSHPLHSPMFLPDDDAVRHVAMAMLAGYLAGTALLGN
ncbi:MAG: amidohydrolase [Candidatus Dormiibacter spiritus]|nr:MAG: amidohydrolase [Candidatus Dormibacteraeota bacterium]